MYSKPWKSCKKEVRKRLGEKSCPVNDDFLSLIWSCLFEFIYSAWQYPFWSRGEKMAMDKNSSAEVLLCGPLYKEVGVNWFIYNFQLKFPLRLRRHFQIYWIHSWYVQICHQFCRTTGNSKRVSSPETNQALHCTTRNAQAAACPGLISQNGIQTSDGAKRGSEEVDVVHVSSNVDSMARNLDLLSIREYMKEGMAIIQYSNDVMFRCLLVCWCRSLFVFPWAETGTLTYQQSLVHVYGGISHQRVSSLCVSDSELSAETKKHFADAMVSGRGMSVAH